MPPEFIRGSYLWEPVFAVGILAIFGLGTWLLSVVLGRLTRHQRERSPDSLALALLGAVHNPLLLFLPLQGIFLALASLSPLESWQDGFVKTWSVLLVALVTYGVGSVSNAALNWYIRVVAPRTRTQFDDQLMPLLRRISTITIYGVGGLIILDQLGLSISPLLAGLGIGGLAVALALQPTLSNFFAGTYVISDGAVRVGDYVALEAGQEGYVIEVGWRNIKIRTYYNTLVIIPNSKFADSIVTNYFGPTPEINVFVTGGVSYESDLEHVERVSLEVAREVLEDCPGAVKGFAPWFAFDNFGDSNIGFWLFVQAKDRVGSFTVQHELIKGLRARFAREGIEINYPVRKLVYPARDGIQPPMS